MDLGKFTDLPSALGFAPDIDAKISKSQLFEVFGKLPNFPTDFKLERGKTIEHDGVKITELSWSTGYGPRTQSYLVVPADTEGPLPGVLFLHSHDDVKGYGKEKLVEGAVSMPAEYDWLRRDHYGDRAPANVLAKRGYAVLTFDCFMWGSRNFSLDEMPERLIEILGVKEYERLAVMHESMVLSKYLSLFGTTLAGLLNFDDRVAFEVAKSLPEIGSKIAVMGLSGGGCRTIYMHATVDEIAASVTVGAMATYESMIDKHVAGHSWMFWPQDLAKYGDWPAVAMMGAPKPLYVQYCGNDQLFTKQGMKDADEYFIKNYPVGKYKGSTYPVKHSFTAEMQDDAFDWLDANVK